uniref:SFRICE_013797 n=1 Tax=Spodoptera frugiperda TaxID=7108 RepID=A0A2H1V6H9_SPOFR
MYVLCLKPGMVLDIPRSAPVPSNRCMQSCSFGRTAARPGPHTGPQLQRLPCLPKTGNAPATPWVLQVSMGADRLPSALRWFDDRSGRWLRGTLSLHYLKRRRANEPPHAPIVTRGTRGGEQAYSMRASGISKPCPATSETKQTLENQHIVTESMGKKEGKVGKN